MHRKLKYLTSTVFTPSHNIIRLAIYVIFHVVFSDVFLGYTSWSKSLCTPNGYNTESYK
jgi:hypothetical protein